MDQITLIDDKGHSVNFYPNGDALRVYSIDAEDDEQTDVSLKEKQIKELMLFLDRKYGYLLEGVK